MALSREATGFALAGGASRRMGRDKALLPWGAGTLLEHTLERLRETCGQVRILCGAELRYADLGVPVDPDLVPAAGPLGGLLTGLSRLGPEPGLFLGVDLPFVPAGLLALLLELAEDYDAVVPVAAGKVQPLCALYRAACREPIRRRIEAGQLRMTSFWPEVRVLEVGEERLARFGPPARLFLNLNTPADYEATRL